MKDIAAAWQSSINEIYQKTLSRIIIAYGSTILKKILDKTPLSICDKWTLRKTIREACGTQKNYNDFGSIIYNMIIKYTETATPDEVQKLIDSANAERIEA